LNTWVDLIASYAFASHAESLVAHTNLTRDGERLWPDFVTIARCTIRLRHVDAADSDLFHDAKSSNMHFPLRFY
jgi:hypothetical protein